MSGSGGNSTSVFAPNEPQGTKEFLTATEKETEDDRAIGLRDVDVRNRNSTFGARISKAHETA